MNLQTNSTKSSKEVLMTLPYTIIEFILVFINLILTFAAIIDIGYDTTILEVLLMIVLLITSILVIIASIISLCQKDKIDFYKKFILTNMIAKFHLWAYIVILTEIAWCNNEYRLKGLSNYLEDVLMLYIILIIGVIITNIVESKSFNKLLSLLNTRKQGEK